MQKTPNSKIICLSFVLSFPIFGKLIGLTFETRPLASNWWTSRHQPSTSYKYVCNLCIKEHGYTIRKNKPRFPPLPCPQNLVLIKHIHVLTKSSLLVQDCDSIYLACHSECLLDDYNLQLMQQDKFPLVASDLAAIKRLTLPRFIPEVCHQ